MSDHPSLERIVQYRDGALAPDELLGVDDHLATCADLSRCARRRCPNRQAGSNRRWSPPVHVTTSTSTPSRRYVDGTLVETDREIADAHLSSCSLCAEDLGDLRRDSRGTVWRWLPPRRRLGGRGWHSSSAAAAHWPVRPPSLSSPLCGRAPGSTGRPVTTVKPEPPVATHAPAPGAPPTMAALRDGPFAVTVDERGNLTGLPELPAAESDGAGQGLDLGAARRGRRYGSWRTCGRVDGGVTGGTSGSLSAAAPVATAVESDRPTFRWTAHRGALGYVVTIYDDQFNEVARSSEGLRLEWTPASPLRARRHLRVAGDGADRARRRLGAGAAGGRGAVPCCGCQHSGRARAGTAHLRRFAPGSGCAVCQSGLARRG